MSGPRRSPASVVARLPDARTAAGLAFDVRPLVREQAAAAAALITTAAERDGTASAWSSPEHAVVEAAALVAGEPEGAVGVFSDGVLAGVGWARLRGEAATLGPFAVRDRGAGAGGVLLDALLARADEWGALAVRAHLPATATAALGLLAARGFVVVDTTASIERAANAGASRLDAARGLEVAAVRAAELPELAALDERVTGLSREEDLRRSVAIVARRRGAMVGYLGAHGAHLGPALALDAADLAVLIARALAGAGSGAGVAVSSTETVRARVSLTAPGALLAALALGFRVTASGLVLSRGPGQPIRAAQLYATRPEVV